ncbi:MAG: carbon-nitrogen hydrolase family protein [Rhodospirillales bacterium]|nr:carbon-nitrogen hydrolase family protein [Rhodospirillales bacterium]
MSRPFQAACLQVNAQPDIAANLAAVGDLARQAKAKGAEMVLLPENVAMMDFGRPNIVAKAAPEDRHPALAGLSALAAELGVWLHGGTIHVLLDDGRVANRSCVFDPKGVRVAQYDKIHMFDVDLDGGESYRESQTFRPGEQAVVVPTPWGGLGLSVCYDLRFPHLYRALAKAGASMLTVPAAFTRQTGQAHWHVLLRARAIENGCWVLAPAQCGDHAGSRQTFGHALIVDPWGVVVADAGETPGLAMATIDPAQSAEARRKIPALSHDRPFTLA